MSKRQAQQTQYLVLTGCASDKLKERYDKGDVTPLEKWPAKTIEWLIGKGAIKVVDDDG